jgi:serine phosphatase RsbU (regulator of sigma subunit)
MASDKKRSRRAEAEDEAPAGDPLQERVKDRAAKGGGGFPGAIPIVSGLAAGALAFAGVMALAGQVAPKDPYETFDAAGVQSARMLGVMDIDRWQPGFGGSSGVQAAAKKLAKDKKAEAFASGDDAGRPAFEEALAQWFTGVNAPGTKFRMGLDMVFPAKDSADEAAARAREQAIPESQKLVPGAFVGAMILNRDGAALINYPVDLPGSPQGNRLAKTVGETQVYDTTVGGKPVRWYQHPMRNRLGNPEGAAVVILSTASVKEVSLLPVAAAAAGLALLGGFLGAMILAGGTKNALSRLASDTEALAKGYFDTKVSPGGPAVVQQIGRNAQKLAALAQSGAGAAPQVVVQEVVRAPVQEINDSLAPLKSFERPDELEVEATQKTSVEVGNDYYDVVNVDAEHVGVFIADAPVRGVRSAMLMASIRALFRANYKGEASPAEVLKKVNKGFAVDLARGVYVTAMYAVVNKTTGVVKVASAQHLPIVFWKMSKKASARLSPEGIALGLDPGPVFDKTISEKAIQLEKGDRIMLFTDGAINAKSPAGVQYGEERFYYVVNKEAPKNSAACVNFVANDVDLFHEGAPLMDDFTIVTVRKMR